MFCFTVAFRDQLTTAQFERLLQYRYDVFIKRLRWNLPGRLLGREIDDFDTDRALYVVCHDSDWNLVGCGRLIPTTEPYLLAQEFPEVATDIELPRSDAIWELSRFAAMPTQGRSARIDGLANAVFARCAQAVAAAGGQRMIGVLSTAAERALLRRGLPLRRLGPPTHHTTGSVVGCAVDLPG